MQTFQLHRDWRFDSGVRFIAHDFKVFVLVVKNRIGFAFDVQFGIRHRCTAQLQCHLLGVVAVNVAIATGPNEIAHIQIALLRHHVREQGIAGNIERHAQENIGTALVQLAAQFAFAIGCGGWCNIKLEKGMAWHQRHFVQLTHVPTADNDAARIGVGFQGF